MVMKFFPSLSPHDDERHLTLRIEAGGAAKTELKELQSTPAIEFTRHIPTQCNQK